MSDELSQISLLNSDNCDNYIAMLSLTWAQFINVNTINVMMNQEIF